MGFEGSDDVVVAVAIDAGASVVVVVHERMRGKGSGVELDQKRVADPNSTYVMHTLLRGVVRRGTATRLRNYGLGFVAGTVLGIGVAFVVSRGLMPITAFGGATAGHLVGRRVRTPRCSACATVVRANDTTCPSCRAALRGDIASLSERLDAEERLEDA